MARKPRIHYPGAMYHVMLRGNAKQAVFHQDAEYRYFEEILAQGLAEFRGGIPGTPESGDIHTNLF